MEILENCQESFSNTRAGNNSSSDAKPQVPAFIITPKEVSIQEYMNSGYATDDESSDCEDITGEPVDSGRTRSSKRKAANQASQQSADDATTAEQQNKSDDNKGRKRKKNEPGHGSGSESDGEGNSRRRMRVDDTNGLTGDQPVCSCPKDVMTCIGILPSLPIVSRFYDSDDSENSQEEESFPVLPAVVRSTRHRGAPE